MTAAPACQDSVMEPEVTSRIAELERQLAEAMAAVQAEECVSR